MLDVSDVFLFHLFYDTTSICSSVAFFWRFASLSFLAREKGWEVKMRLFCKADMILVYIYTLTCNIYFRHLISKKA
jgi:hypothetical protein